MDQQASNVLLEHWQDVVLIVANVLVLAGTYWRLVVRISAVERNITAIKESVEHIDDHKVDLGVCKIQHSGIEGTLKSIQIDIRDLRDIFIKLLEKLNLNAS